MGWFCVDDDGNLAKKETHPLLVGHMPVMVAKQPEFKVRASFAEDLLGEHQCRTSLLRVERKSIVSIGDGYCWEPTNKAQPHTVCLCGLLLARVIVGHVPLCYSGCLLCDAPA